MWWAFEMAEQGFDVRTIVRMLAKDVLPKAKVTPRYTFCECACCVSKKNLKNFVTGKAKERGLERGERENGDLV
jgi:hypothetical protein